MKKGILVKIIKDNDTLHKEIVHQSKRNIKKTIEHAIKYRYSYEEDKARTFPEIKGRPFLHIKETNYKENNTLILAEFSYVFKEEKTKNKNSKPFSVLKTIAITTAIIAILTFSLSGISKVMYAKKIAVQEICFKYVKHGVPKAIEINNRVYRLNTDGSIKQNDAFMMPQIHREILAYDNCIKVSLDN